MAPKNWKDRIIDYMLAHGYEEVRSASTKYRVFKPSPLVRSSDPLRRYYVGASGAVRVSKHATIASAVSVTDLFKQRVQLWEMQQQVVHTPKENGL